MVVICCIDVITLTVLVWIAAVKGLDAALPFATFACVLIPHSCLVPLPGLFDLTAQRLVLALLLLLYIVEGVVRPNPPVLRDTPLKWLIAAQLTWALLSTANSIVPLTSLKKLIGVAFEYYALYYIFVKTVRSTKSIQRIVYGIVGALAVSSVFGVLEAYTGWSVLSLFPTGLSRVGQALGFMFVEQTGRISATFPHPILFGAALAIAIPLALRLLSTAKSNTTKTFIWAAILLMFLNIYRAFSRGPWLGLMLAFILLLLFERGRVFKYQLAIASLSVLVLVIRPGVYDSIANLYGESVGDANWSNPKGLSAQYRFELRRVSQAALARDFERSLWGYGLESFFDLHLEGNLAGHKFPFLSCDSAWIEMAVETGYVGIVLFALLLMKPAWQAWNDFRRIRGQDRYLSLTFFTCMLAYYFMMISVAMYSWGQEGYILWILVALSAVHHQLKNFPPRGQFVNGTLVRRRDPGGLTAGGGHQSEVGAGRTDSRADDSRAGLAWFKSNL